MASTYTTNIGLQEPATGDQVNTWGNTVNGNMTTVDNVIGGATTYTFTTTDIQLTVAQAAYFRIVLIGTPSANLNLIFPATIAGTRYIQNFTTGTGAITVKNGASDTGGGIIVPQGLITSVVLTAGQAYYDDYQAVPPGVILPYAGTVAPPGFLFTIGQTLSTATYTQLFNAIGYTYGGSGSSFVLPDTRGRILAAADDMGGSAANRLPGYSISVAGGTSTVTLDVTHIPSHTHTDSGHTHGVTDAGHSHSYLETQLSGTAGGGGVVNGVAVQNSTTTGTSTTGITINSGTANLQNTGGGAAHGNVQPTIAVNHIIRF